MPVASSFLDVEDGKHSGFQATLEDFASPYIVTGDGTGSSGSREFASAFDAVAAITDNTGRFCTGTLISPNLVLSARHCNINNSDQVLFGDNADNPTFTASISSVSNPGGNGIWFDGGDISLLRLSTNVPSSVATPIPLAGETDSLVGQTVSIFGYGLNGVGSEGHNETSDGFRWGGQNVVDFYGDFGGGENLFLADFDDGTSLANTLGGSSIQSDSSPVDFEAITTEGDSGSPIIASINGTPAVVAINSGGLDIRGQYGSIAFWTGVGRFAQVISDEGGSFVGAFAPSNEGSGGVNGGSGGEPITLPADDDHGNEVGTTATDLVFQSDGMRLTARENGFIGFGETLVERDVFQFSTSFEGRIIVDARQLSGNLDTAIRVYDAQGNLLDENNDSVEPASGNPTDSQLILRNMPAGSYFVSVNASNGSNGAYRLAVRTGASSTSGGEPGGTFNSASRVFFGDQPTTFVSAAIENSIDRDFFEFTAAQTGRIVIRSKALSGNLNTVLRGYSNDQLQLDANNNYKGSLDSRVSFNVIEGRNYFFRLNSVGSTSGDYRLSLRMANSAENLQSSTPFSLRLDTVASSQQVFADAAQSADRLTRESDFSQGLLAAV